ncbi:MAG TPA: hypothetical protein PKD92_11655, partial [Novosphingobium sp.]|nr:hypothetical protein [Novosphingobium sp.]
GMGGDDALAIVNSAPSGGAPTTHTGAGSVFDGGEGIDFLTVGGVVNFQGTLLNIEGIHLQNSYTLNNGAFGSQARAQLTISFAEISKLGPNARFDGVGDVFVTLDLNDNLDTSGFVFAAGSDVIIDLGGVTVTGSSGNDSLTGTGGNDTLILGGGRDTLVAGGGDDIVVINGPVAGGSSLNGGAGTDTLQVDTVNPATVASSLFPQGIATSTLGITGATVTGFERVVFNSAADTVSNFAILLNQATSAFASGPQLVGGAGYDTLQVIATFNTGNSPSGYVLNAPVFTYDNWQDVDRAYQAGDRVLVFNSGNADGVINGSAHAGVQILVGGAGNETINGSAAAETIRCSSATAIPSRRRPGGRSRLRRPPSPEPVRTSMAARAAIS